MLSADQERRREREQRAAELGQRALALRREGKPREAVQALREAVRLAPRHAGLVGNLGNALFAAGERAAAIVALERACWLEPGSGQLAYNLGKALLDEGRLGAARAAFERELERIAQAFDADFFRALGAAHASEAPLFVVGLPRSGTTLVESILAAHPAVTARGERVEIDRLARSWRSRGYPERAREIPPAERHAAAEAYLRALALPAGARRATDKLPGNYVHLGLVAMLFPSARVVHCRRDPLDTALSLFCQLFEGGALAFGYGLEHIARVIRAHRRLMEHWRACLPLALLELDYEELVRDVERGSRELVRFAGLDWDERCLARSSDAAVHTASAWRVRAPVDGSSVGRWRRYAGELAPLRAALAAPPS